MAALLVACATNPVTGRRELVLMSPQRETALGRQASAEVEREIGLLREPALAAYVEAVGERLARASPRRDVSYRFAIADMPEPNAFALPGGWIYVSRGLLVLTNGEDELANVLGHEVGHVAARHAAQRETRAAGAGVLSVIGVLAAGALGGTDAARAASQVGQVAAAGLIASYGREQERQADEVGQRLVAETGWDPTAMSAFLRTLEREQVQRSGRARLPTFLDSHPSTRERIEATAARASGLARAAGAPAPASRAAYLARLEGLLVGPDPAEGVFEGNRFLHPGLGFVLGLPDGWETVNEKAAVGAIAPRRDALVVLEVAGPPGDPREAAARFAGESGIALEAARTLEIGGYAALRARARARAAEGPLELELTWIAHPRALLRVAGAAPPARFAAHAAAMRATAESFRALREAERGAIRALRLAVARARAGESLTALGARTANRWSVEETAVANALAPGAALAAGQLVKIAVEAPLERAP